MIKQLPNLFTLLNLFFGCLAIVHGLQAGVILSSDPLVPPYLLHVEKIWMVSLFIGLAAVVDFLDGFLARILQADSAMGKQLDSLADLVSFGVAPALLLYHMLLLAWAPSPQAMEIDSVLFWPAFFLPMASAWRLARFNLTSSSPKAFKGLPVPAAGLFIASLPLIYWSTELVWVSSLLTNVYFLYALIGVLSALMISPLPLMTMKFDSFAWDSNLPRYLLIALSIGCVFLFHWMSIPLIIILYVLLSLLFKNKLT